MLVEDEIAIASSMNDWFQENRAMSEKKYYLELPLTREGKIHQRWPSDRDTVERMERLTSREPYYATSEPEPRAPIGMLVVGLVLIGVAMIAGFYVAIFGV
jgi:hypothetical protein